MRTVFCTGRSDYALQFFDAGDLDCAAFEIKAQGVNTLNHTLRTSRVLGHDFDGMIVSGRSKRIQLYDYAARRLIFTIRPSDPDNDGSTRKNQKDCWALGSIFGSSSSLLLAADLGVSSQLSLVDLTGKEVGTIANPNAEAIGQQESNTATTTVWRDFLHVPAWQNELYCTTVDSHGFVGCADLRKGTFVSCRSDPTASRTTTGFRPLTILFGRSNRSRGEPIQRRLSASIMRNALFVTSSESKICKMVARNCLHGASSSSSSSSTYSNDSDEVSMSLSSRGMCSYFAEDQGLLYVGLANERIEIWDPRRPEMSVDAVFMSTRLLVRPGGQLPLRPVLDIDRIDENRFVSGCGDQLIVWDCNSKRLSRKKRTGNVSSVCVFGGWGDEALFDQRLMAEHLSFSGEKISFLQKLADLHSYVGVSIHFVNFETFLPQMLLLE